MAKATKATKSTKSTKSTKATDSKGVALPTVEGFHAKVETVCAPYLDKRHSGKGSGRRADDFVGFHVQPHARVIEALNAVRAMVADGRTSNPGGRLKANASTAQARNANPAALGANGCITLGLASGPGGRGDFGRAVAYLRATMGATTLPSGATYSDLQHGADRCLALSPEDATAIVGDCAHAWVEVQGMDANDPDRTPRIKALWSLGCQAYLDGAAWREAIERNDGLTLDLRAR